MPFAGFGQAGHWRYIDGYGMTILKGATTSDTIAHFTGDKLFDHFGKVRLRDTARLDARINYHTNLHGSFTAYSLIDKAYLDSVLSTLGGGSGDFSSNTSTSVDNEVVLFSGTGGKTGKRATGTGIAKLTSGVLSVSNVNLTSEVTGTLPVANGGTGLATLSTYALMAGGTTATGIQQQVSGLGTSGQVLTSNGAGALPTWQDATVGGGGGDFSSNTSSSVDDEIVLFSGTGGKTGKRATSTGILLGTSGVLSATTLSSGISGQLSDETGTGVVVFGTNPTLTAATMAGNLTNNSAGAYDIGSTGTRFRYIFANGLNINSSGAGATNTINVISGFTLTNGGSVSSASNVFTFSSAPATNTTGTTNGFTWGTFGFTPTSGTGVFNLHRFAHTINQTGGASGISRTILIDPTITAAADYRAIETMTGKIRFNGLVTATTPDSLIAYEDGELKPTTALNMPGAVLWRSSNTTATSGTGETDLFTYTTPANTLNATDEFLEYDVEGLINVNNVSNSNLMRVRVYWAGTEVAEVVSLSSAAQFFTCKVRVIRTSSSNARVSVAILSGAVVLDNTDPIITDVTTTFTNTNIIKITGESSDATKGVNAQIGTLKRWK